MRKAVCCRVLGFAVIAAALVIASPAAPADQTGAKPAPVATAPPPVDELGRGTPQSALRGFLDAAALHNYRRAASYLDLRRIPAADVAARGPELARQLRVVLDNTRFDLGAISDEPEGRPETGLASNRELIGRVETDKGTFSLLMERVPRDDGVLIWKYSAATVAHVPELYRELGFGPLEERLPPFLVEWRPLRIALWQWLGLALLVALAVLLARLLVRRRPPVTRWLLARSRVRIDAQVLARAVARAA